jgi:hypothetical protein
MNRNEKAKIRYMIEQKCLEHRFPMPDHPYGYTLLNVSKWLPNEEFLAFCEWIQGRIVADDAARGKVITSYDMLKFLDERRDSVL